MAAKAPARTGPAEGVQFPTTAGGDRSSSTAGKEVFKAAIAAVDAKDAEAVANEKNWRFGYTKHVVRALELSAKSSDKAIKIAQAGLDYTYKNFEFVRDGQTCKVEEAMKKFTGTFETGFVKGKKAKAEKQELEIPYKGRTLKGKELIAQIDKWANYGTIEPSCADGLKACVLHPEWLDLSDKYFVLCGAGSAMGPFLILTALGANIIALDLDRAPIWKRLIETVENSSATITFPMRKPQTGLVGDALYEAAGCNLFTECPELKNWVVSLYPDKELVVGCYAYLDGELHVRLSVAMDMIVRGAVEQRKGTAVAYLNTPTQTFVVSPDARKASDAEYSKFSLFNLIMTPLRLFGGRRFLVKNYTKPAVVGEDGKSRNIIDSLVVPQGPNYALAKTLQHWRAVTARWSGQLVSSNVAPSTATVSVVSNRSFAWAYGGMYYFKPMEIFNQETSNAVMATLLINDIRNNKSAANPKTTLAHPYDLFTEGAFHGGIWRQAYQMTSVGEVAAVLYFWDKAKPAVLLAVLVAIVAVFMSRA